MYPFVGGFEQPSPRDILTMYTLYNTAADYTAGERSGSSAKKSSATHSIWVE
jgi:hypothetical protein